MFILLTVVSEGFLQEPKGVPELWENQQPSSSMHKFIRVVRFVGHGRTFYYEKTCIADTSKTGYGVCIAGLFGLDKRAHA